MYCRGSLRRSTTRRVAADMRSSTSIALPQIVGTWPDHDRKRLGIGMERGAVLASPQSGATGHRHQAEVSHVIRSRGRDGKKQDEEKTEKEALRESARQTRKLKMGKLI